MKADIMRITVRCAACNMVVSDQLQDLNVFGEWSSGLTFEQLVEHVCEQSIVERDHCEGGHVALVRFKTSYELKRST